MAETREPSLEIRDLKLERYVKELEENGLTIVPPEVTRMTGERVGKLIDLLLQRASEMVGCNFTVGGGPDSELEYDPDAEPVGIVVRTGTRPEQLIVQQLTGYHRMFRDLAVNPVAVALVRHMIGENRTRFSSCQSFLKWEGTFGYGKTLGIHADQTALPLPWGSSAFNANTNWCLTDYTRDGGSLAYVPGSHLRNSRPDKFNAASEAVPVEAGAGSLIVFHGATWHGAYPRKMPGMRVSVATLYRHLMVTPQEDMRHSMDRKLADDCCNPELFRELAGFNDLFPYSRQLRPLRTVLT